MRSPANKGILSYNDLAKLVHKKSKALGAFVLVFEGPDDVGMGYCVPYSVHAVLPEYLEQVAQKMRDRAVALDSQGPNVLKT